MNSESRSLRGSCLCSAVNVTINPPENIFDACHCGMYRKWASGPVFTLEAGDHLVYEPIPSFFDIE